MFGQAVLARGVEFLRSIPWAHGPRSARARGLLVGVVVVLLVGGVSPVYGNGLATMAGFGGGQLGVSASGVGAEARAAVAARRRWLESRGVRARRVVSRMAFHGLSVGGARGLLVRDYGSVLAGVSGNPAASVKRSGRVVRYLNAHRALVRTPQGLRVESSTVPLRVASGSGVQLPVDLDLTARGGGFAPVTPLAALSIAADSGGGVSVGSDGLRLTLLGADVAGSVVGGQDVFYGDVGADADAMVAPTVSGVDLSLLLRSRLSPEQFRYRVALPEGATLAAVDGGAVVSRGGVVLARVPAPSARDAQGSVVPVTMGVAGDELLLTVRHRGMDVAYPLLVDPTVTVPLNGTGEEWALGVGDKEYIAWEAGPLSIAANVSYPLKTGISYSYGDEGNWELVVPWNLEITKVSFLGVSGHASASGGGAAYWRLLACGATTGYQSGTPPTSVTFEEKAPRICGSEHHTFSLALQFWGNGEENVTDSGAISAESMLVTYVPSGGEEEEFRAEGAGTGNPGEPNHHSCLSGNPVNCATGNQVETQSDLSVGGRGPGLSMTRTYNSQVAAHQSEHGAFGFGWTASYGAHIHFSTDLEGRATAAVYQDNGSDVRFEYASGSGKWVASDPLVQSALVKEGSDYIYTLPNQSKLTFNEEGRLLSEADRDGNTVTMSYESGRLVSVADAAGRKLTYAYNGEGEVESVKDPLGHTVKYVYESGNLKSVTQPGEVALRWQFKYNSEHELTSETDGRNHTIITEYNGSQQVISQTDALERKRKWKYATTESGTETTITEPNGSTTVEQFNTAGLPTSVTRASGTALASATTHEYNGSDELVATTDPNKHTTEYGYDSAGNRTSEKNADGDETKWKYDSTHDIETVTIPDGETTTIKREGHGNPEVVERPAPSSTTQKTVYKYDSKGDVESVTDPLEHAWKYEYDSYGDRKAEIDPEGNKRTWEYNEDSQETATVSPVGNEAGGEPSKHTTTIERDAQGRPLTITDPLKHKTQFTYDGDGNIETITDPEKNKTKYTYDADNERTKVEEPNKATTETGYDTAGQVTSRTDGNKRTTKYVRNSLEEVTEVVDPKERKTIEEYDSAGNPTEVIDAAGRTTTYTHDPANRLTKISYSDGKTHAVEYEYNKDGKMTVMTDGTGTTTNTYDQLDRLTETEDGHKETVKYEYNLANAPTKITYPNSKAVTRAYDKDERLEKTTDWLSHATQFSYDADSNLLATTFPSETKDEDKYTYDNDDLINTIKMKKSSETIVSLSYSRTKDNQTKGITSKGLPGEEKPAYEYDENNRLTKAGTLTYEYDPANNPTKLATNTYKYDPADQLESGTGATYTYNEAGQRTKTTPSSGPTTTYSYDQAGNLTAVERPEGESKPKIEDTYAYNGEGLRASETISGATNYLTWDTALELPLILNNGAESFVYGPQGMPVEQINTEGKVQYLHHDQAGSTRLTTGSTGTTEATFTYDGYGNLTGHTGTATTPLGYDAQYTTPDTNLIYLRARTYDPTTAQFLSRDPLAAITGEPYSYAADDPMDLADPSGRCGLVCWGGIALGGLAVATGVGEVVIGGTLAVEGTLGAISVVSGAVGASVDLKECAGGSSVSCVGAITGGVGAAGAFGVATGLLTGGAASGATAVGLTSGGIGFLGDTAGAVASPGKPENDCG
jgi:RHS repeat-associated protein